MKRRRSDAVDGPNPGIQREEATVEDGKLEWRRRPRIALSRRGSEDGVAMRAFEQADDEGSGRRALREAPDGIKGSLRLENVSQSNDGGIKTLAVEESRRCVGEAVSTEAAARRVNAEGPKLTVERSATYRDR